MELATLRAKHAALAPVLTERSRRVWAATEAQAIGYGGTALVARATGIATSTIQRGLRELTADEPLAGGRTRRAGGGRKRAIDLDATLLRDLDALVEPTAPGDPDSPLRWTCQSARTLAVALDGLGHRVSHTVVAELLHGLGYSLQGNAKTREGRQHVDRDAQFRYIARRVRRAQRQQQPTISVDTKKKELVGAFKNAGRTWRPAKTPPRVQVHDFVIPATATTGGKAIPYGIYDLHRNEGWVSVGIDHDTASFAVRSIQRWWQHGSPGVSTSPVAVDHGGCRREQRGAPPVVEVGTAASGQSDGLGDHGLSLSAGYEQVEQDRASVVLAHRDELARHPTRRLGHDREPHWLDAQSVRTPRSVGTRPRPIPGWHHRHRCAAGDGTPRAASLSRRLELHDPSRCSENTKVSNCLTSPNGSSGSALGENLQCSFGLILAKLDAVASCEFLPFSRIVAEPPS